MYKLLKWLVWVRTWLSLDRRDSEKKQASIQHWTKLSLDPWTIATGSLEGMIERSTLKADWVCPKGVVSSLRLVHDICSWLVLSAVLLNFWRGSGNNIGQNPADCHPNHESCKWWCKPSGAKESKSTSCFHWKSSDCFLDKKSAGCYPKENDISACCLSSALGSFPKTHLVFHKKNLANSHF